jgi:hypothetical protein
VPPEKDEALDVLPTGLNYLDATAVAFHLHDRDILDAIAMFFSEYEQLGVEKPGLVLNLRDDRGSPVVCLVFRTPPMTNERNPS